MRSNTSVGIRLFIMSIAALLAACSSGGQATSPPAASATAAASASAAATPAASPSAEVTAGPPIVVGMSVGLTSFLASADGAVADGAKLAADELNAADGVGGRQLQLEILDMASTPTTAVTVVNELINAKSADVLVNGFSSAATGAIAPLIGAAEVPAIVASILPEDPSWTFSTLPPVRYSVETQLQFAAENLKVSKIAVLASQTPYGQLAMGLMVDKAPEFGLEVVDSQAIEATVTDLTSAVGRARDRGAEAILDVLTGPIHLVLAEAAANLNLSIPIVMATDTMNIFGQATETYPETHFLAFAPQVYPDIKDPDLKALNERYIELWTTAYGDEGDLANGSRGYDAIHILANVMSTTGATEGAALRDALEAMPAYHGVSAIYDYSPEDHVGITSNPFFVAHLQDGAVAVELAP